DARRGVVGALEPSVSVRDDDGGFVRRAPERRPDRAALEIGDAVDVEPDRRARRPLRWSNQIPDGEAIPLADGERRHRAVDRIELGAQVARNALHDEDRGGAAIRKPLDGAVHYA